MISCRHCTVTVDDKILLADINLEVAQGDYLCIVGPNGSGKSTLLKMLLAILPSQSGSLIIDGKSIEHYSSKSLAQLVSYVPQNGGMHQTFTVEEFVQMARYSYHSVFSNWQPQDHQSVEQALQITQCDGFRWRHMSTLSGGECQRVMIAAALAQDAPVMLLDEPTAFLDPHHQVAVHQLIRQLNQQHHKTIIEVTHDINHAAHHARHILALREGHCLWHGKAGEFFDATRLKTLYEQTFVFARHPHHGQLIAVADES